MSRGFPGHVLRGVCYKDLRDLRGSEFRDRFYCRIKSPKKGNSEPRKTFSDALYSFKLGMFSEQ